MASYARSWEYNSLGPLSIFCGHSVSQCVSRICVLLQHRYTGWYWSTFLWHVWWIHMTKCTLPWTLGPTERGKSVNMTLNLVWSGTNYGLSPANHTTKEQSKRPLRDFTEWVDACLWAFGRWGCHVDHCSRYLDNQMLRPWEWEMWVFLYVWCMRPVEVDCLLT